MLQKSIATKNTVNKKEESSEYPLHSSPVQLILKQCHECRKNIHVFSQATVASSASALVNAAPVSQSLPDTWTASSPTITLQSAWNSFPFYETQEQFRGSERIAGASIPHRW